MTSQAYFHHNDLDEARRERALEFVLEGRQGPWNAEKTIDEAKKVEAYLKGEELSGAISGNPNGDQEAG